MLGACISISKNIIVPVLKIPWALQSKESTLVACLIQLEQTLMSVLGYIVKAIVVSQRNSVHIYNDKGAEKHLTFSFKC